MEMVVDRMRLEGWRYGGEKDGGNGGREGERGSEGKEEDRRNGIATKVKRMEDG